MARIWIRTSFAAVSIALLAACNNSPGDNPKTQQGSQETPVHPIAAPLLQVVNAKFQTCSDVCPGDPGYERAQHPYWTQRVIVEEPVMPIYARVMRPDGFKLWRPASKILSVRFGDVTYRASHDYVLRDGRLFILAGAIKPVPNRFLRTLERGSPLNRVAKDRHGRPLRLAEGFADRQLLVTYETASPAQRPAPAKQFPRFSRLLADGHPVRITYYGDSISLGASASRGHSFADVVSTVLARKYPGQVHWRNQSVGGRGCYGGFDSAEASLNDATQDLVVIGFGMNDATNSPYAPTAAVIFKEKLRGIIETVRAKAPDTEFLLLSSMRGNPNWRPMNTKMFPRYRAAMNELAAELPGISVADMTSVWDTLAARKAFEDVSANGVNHPVDFIHAIYTDVILNALLP